MKDENIGFINEEISEDTLCVNMSCIIDKAKKLGFIDLCGYVEYLEYNNQHQRNIVHSFMLSKGQGKNKDQTTKGIADINEFERYWMSKFNKQKYLHKQGTQMLQKRIDALIKRAKVDYLINERFRNKYPKIHAEIYKELHEEGIKTIGIKRAPHYLIDGKWIKDKEWKNE